MPIEYPSTLPTPIADGYGLKHVSPLMRTEMDSGRARQRRRFTSVPTMASVTWFFDSPEACMAFEGFFKYTLLDGAEWFNCPLKTPLGFADYEARFAGMYDGPAITNGIFWTISATIEIRERQIVTEDWIIYGIEHMKDFDIFDRAMNDLWPAA